MTHTGGGGAKVKYGSAFLYFLYDQLLMVEDYVYTVTDLRGDLDLPLLTGA